MEEKPLHRQCPRQKERENYLPVTSFKQKAEGRGSGNSGPVLQDWAEEVGVVIPCITGWAEQGRGESESRADPGWHLGSTSLLSNSASL